MRNNETGTTVFVIPEAKFGKAGAARLANDGTLVFAVEGVQGEFDGDELIALDCPDPQQTLIVGLRWIAELQTNPHYIIGNPAMYELLKDAVLIEDAPELGFGRTRLTRRGENAVEAYRVYQPPQSTEPMLDVMLNPDDTPQTPAQVDGFLFGDVKRLQAHELHEADGAPVEDKDARIRQLEALVEEAAQVIAPVVSASHDEDFIKTYRESPVFIPGKRDYVAMFIDGENHTLRVEHLRTIADFAAKLDAALKK